MTVITKSSGISDVGNNSVKRESDKTVFVLAKEANYFSDNGTHTHTHTHFKYVVMRHVNNIWVLHRYNMYEVNYACTSNRTRRVTRMAPHRRLLKMEDNLWVYRGRDGAMHDVSILSRSE